MMKALFIKGLVNLPELRDQYVELLPETGDFLVCDTSDKDYLTVVVKRSLHFNSNSGLLTEASGVGSASPYLALRLPRAQIKDMSPEDILQAVAAKFKYIVNWDFDLTLAAEHTTLRYGEKTYKEGVPIRNQEKTVQILKRLQDPYVQLGVNSKTSTAMVIRYFNDWNQDPDNQEVFDTQKFILMDNEGENRPTNKAEFFHKQVASISQSHDTGKAFVDPTINLDDSKQFFVIGSMHVDDSSDEIEFLSTQGLGIDLVEASIDKAQYKEEAKRASEENKVIEQLINANMHPNDNYFGKLNQFADRIENKNQEIITAAQLGVAKSVEPAIEAKQEQNQEQPVLTEAENSSEVPQSVSDSVLLDLVFKHINNTPIVYTEGLLPLREAIKKCYLKELHQQKSHFFTNKPKDHFYALDPKLGVAAGVTHIKTQSEKHRNEVEAHIEDQVELAQQTIMSLTRQKLLQSDNPPGVLTHDELLALPSMYRSLAQLYYGNIFASFMYCKAVKRVPEDNAEQSEPHLRSTKPNPASWVETGEAVLNERLDREQTSFTWNYKKSTATLAGITQAPDVKAKEEIFRQSAQQSSFFRTKETQIFYEVWSHAEAATVLMNALEEVMQRFHLKSCQETWKLGTWGGKTCAYKWGNLSFKYRMPTHAAEFATIYTEIRDYKKHVRVGYQEAIRNLSDCINSTYNSNEKRDPETQNAYNKAWTTLISAYYQLNLAKAAYLERVKDMNGTFSELNKLLIVITNNTDRQKTIKQAQDKIAAAKLHLEAFEANPENQNLSEQQKYLHRAEVLSVLSYELFTLAQNEIIWRERSGSKTYKALMEAVQYCNDIPDSANPDSKISKVVEKYMSEHAQFLQPASEQFNRFYSLETTPSIPRLK